MEAAFKRDKEMGPRNNHQKKIKAVHQKVFVLRRSARNQRMPRKPIKILYSHRINLLQVQKLNPHSQPL